VVHVVGSRITALTPSGAQRERVTSNHLVEVADPASFGRERRAQSAMRIGGPESHATVRAMVRNASTT